MKVFHDTTEFALAVLTEGQFIEAKWHTTDNDNGGARYLVVTAVQFGGTPDEVNDFTLANGNVAAKQYDFYNPVDITEYLPIDGKAADSNLLDGLDSTAFALVGDLAAYLPLTGGTLTGSVTQTNGHLQLSSNANDDGDNLTVSTEDKSTSFNSIAVKRAGDYVATIKTDGAVTEDTDLINKGFADSTYAPIGGGVSSVLASAHFSNAGVIAESYNVSGVTDVGTGRTDVTFATPLPTATYSAQSTSYSESFRMAEVEDDNGGTDVSTTHCKFICMDAGADPSDPFGYNVAFIG
ncbi:MAG: hypothetical protein DRH06_00050 [Deltaproteobacteria bacterium]|nr:MAG: hypothetical protein DRH06_00050 [Deltaproteobacteria bacterium]